jgi:MOSC domain-containing protein YiiM
MNTAAPTVVSVNISPGGIPKRPIDVGRVEAPGIVGDGHNHAKHSSPMVAVSFIDIEDLDDLRAEGYAVYPGAMGENVTLRGLDTDALRIGDRLRFSGGVEVEVTKMRKPCYVLDSIHPKLKEVSKGRCGCLAKVIQAGEIRAGEIVEVIEREAAGAGQVGHESIARPTA